MITFKYNKKDDILYVVRQDEIELEEIIRYIDKIDKQSIHKGSLYILEDSRNAIINFGIKDLPILLEEIKKRISKYDIVKSAIIVDKPLDTALSLFYEKLSFAIKNYYYKSFSTNEAGRFWLKH